MDRVSTENVDNTEVLVMVLGAGRGPLVRAALKASETSGRKVKVIAVEKNTNAVVTLQGISSHTVISSLVLREGSKDISGIL